MRPTNRAGLPVCTCRKGGAYPKIVHTDRGRVAGFLHERGCAMAVVWGERVYRRDRYALVPLETMSRVSAAYAAWRRAFVDGDREV